MSIIQDFPGSKDALTSSAPQRTSEKFRAEDADVTFVSSDNILFRIHGKNLEIATTGFPPAGFDTQGELVPLTENSVTLELLFQYVYPQRHPSLENTPFEILSELAEAAEKYQVFAAMNICYVRMKNVLPDHALVIFHYAFKHDYKDIQVVAAPYLLDIPLDEIAQTLVGTRMLYPWVCYRETWSRTAFQIITTTPPPHCVDGNHNILCAQCRTWVQGYKLQPAQLWVSLGEKRSRTALEALYANVGSSPGCPHFSRGVLFTNLSAALSKVPTFDFFF